MQLNNISLSHLRRCRLRSPCRLHPASPRLGPAAEKFFRRAITGDTPPPPSSATTSTRWREAAERGLGGAAGRPPDAQALSAKYAEDTGVRSLIAQLASAQGPNSTYTGQLKMARDEGRY